VGGLARHWLNKDVNFETVNRTLLLTTSPMNALNAIFFAALGSAMEALPRMFPSWFPPTGADQSSTRALWLATMGAVQITIGLGFVIRAHFMPLVFKVFSTARATGAGTLALPSARGVTTR
jgi:hypothetical protein